MCQTLINLINAFKTQCFAESWWLYYTGLGLAVVLYYTGLGLAMVLYYTGLGLAVVLIQRSSRSTRTVMFAEAPRPYPAQALCYLDHLMAYAPCRTVLLEHNRPALRTVTDSLKNITVRWSFICAALAFNALILLIFVMCLFVCLPSMLWRCWLGCRKGIWPVKNWVVRYWCGYLSAAKCKWFHVVQLMPLSPHHLLVH